jgi:hypothetical protein
MIVISIVIVVKELLVVLAFVGFILSFVTAFILRAINIHTGM